MRSIETLSKSSWEGNEKDKHGKFAMKTWQWLTFLTELFK